MAQAPNLRQQIEDEIDLIDVDHIESENEDEVEVEVGVVGAPKKARRRLQLSWKQGDEEMVGRIIFTHTPIRTPMERRCPDAPRTERIAVTVRVKRGVRRLNFDTDSD